MRHPIIVTLLLVALATVATAVPAFLAGARAMLVVGWTVTTVCAVLFLVSRFGLVPRKLGIVFLILALLALGITILGGRNVLQRVVPYCGDGVCAPDECDGTCEDCQPGQCEDGTCVPDWETCATSDDCTCSPQSVCRPGEDSADRFGCYTVTCGDGHCDGNEDRFTCCKDCGCLTDYSCRNNVCLYNTPKLTFTTHVISDNISATALMANPMLLNRSQHIHPLILLNVRNEVSEANGVKVHLRLGKFDEYTVDLGRMSVSEVEPVLWYGPFDDSLLDVTDDTTINLTINLTYFDGQQTAHTPVWQFPLTIRSRNAVDRYTHPFFFVTPDDVEPAAMTPKGIWQQYSGLEVLPDEPGMRFPLETVADNGGDPDDLAVLLASTFHKAGIKTGLVESEHGLFVRVWEDRAFRIVDPGKLGGGWNGAEAEHPGYEVWMLPEAWMQWNATVLSLS